MISFLLIEGKLNRKSDFSVYFVRYLYCLIHNMSFSQQFLTRVKTILERLVSARFLCKANFSRAFLQLVTHVEKREKF